MAMKTPPIVFLKRLITRGSSALKRLTRAWSFSFAHADRKVVQDHERRDETCPQACSEADRESKLAPSQVLPFGPRFRRAESAEVRRFDRHREGVDGARPNEGLRTMSREAQESWCRARGCTASETRVLIAVAEGKAIADIARDFGLSRAAVRAHLHHAFLRFRTHDQ